MEILPGCRIFIFLGDQVEGSTKYRSLNSQATNNTVLSPISPRLIIFKNIWRRSIREEPLLKCVKFIIRLGWYFNSLGFCKRSGGGSRGEVWLKIVIISLPKYTSDLPNHQAQPDVHVHPPTSTRKKTWIPACPWGKQLSYWACLGPPLSCLR